MHGKLITVYCSLITFFLLSCQPSPTPPPQTSLIVYRFDPPAFVEYSADFQPIKEIPFTIPPSCGLYNTFPAPIGKFLLIELSCPNGQTVLFLDTESDSVSQPVTDSDAHFLAWTSDGDASYLKVDSLGNPRILRVHTSGEQDIVPISEFTYDLAPAPSGEPFTFTFSRGLSFGSEIWLAQADGNEMKQLTTDTGSIHAYARWSPDGNQIAFIKFLDLQIPYSIGSLWVMDADGSNAHLLAEADAGHGYAANWSPDGNRIAFVVRENPGDENANQVSDALISNIYVIDVETVVLTQVTRFTEGRTETPFWSPDGNTLSFNTVVNGRMNVFIADVDNVGVGSSDPVEIQFLETGSTCCPAWMRK